ncbi:MAG: hypothetical protein OXN17_14255 [Candidatus Poribacteria bacterium]|nr:hypothetical protein [Candidatus Poribacteria bacterium]MDE0506870.1 hypothetical protein [Candidatus Poribacteria bacterium]
MERIEITTKPNGAGRNWLEVGSFEIDGFGREEWIKKNAPQQDRRLRVDRRYSDRAETIDWILLVPDDYPLTIIKMNYDRLNPRKVDVIWEPKAASQTESGREDRIRRIFELAQGNDELMALLKEEFGR